MVRNKGSTPFKWNYSIGFFNDTMKGREKQEGDDSSIGERNRRTQEGFSGCIAYWGEGYNPAFPPWEGLGRSLSQFGFERIRMPDTIPMVTYMVIMDEPP